MTKLEKIIGLRTPATTKEENEEKKEMINERPSPIKIAYLLAEAAHANQKRVNGDRYFTHPLGMLEAYENMVFCSNNPYKYEALNDHRIPIEGVREVILLHDVVEDTPMTFKDIKEIFAEYGYKEYYEEYIEKHLMLITHDKNEDYETYIKDVMHSEVASLVKMLDLMNNTNLFGLDKLGDSEYERALRYIKYFKMINDKWHFVEKFTGYKADVR